MNWYKCHLYNTRTIYRHIAGNNSNKYVTQTGLNRYLLTNGGKFKQMNETFFLSHF